MKPNIDTFRVVYDGPALEDGSIPVNDLAPALLSLGDLFEEANQLITNGEASISLRIKSGSEKGSYITDFHIYHYVQNLVNMFSSKEMSALCNVLTVLGFMGISSVGLFQLIQKSKGRKPKKVTRIEKTENISIEFEGDAPLEITEGALNLFNNSKARKAAEGVISPITKDGINTFAVYRKDKEVFKNTITVKKDEVDYFKAEDFILAETEPREEDAYLSIISLSFAENYIWRFKMSEEIKFSAYINDPEFQKKIDRREAFAKDDILHVTLQTKQRVVNGVPEMEYKILKVIEHIRAPFQQKVDFK
ncbi:MAG: hypothetical protein ABII89_00560 [Candidatus Omnitrophota bacterium]